MSRLGFSNSQTRLVVPGKVPQMTDIDRERSRSPKSRHDLYRSVVPSEPQLHPRVDSALRVHQVGPDQSPPRLRLRRSGKGNRPDIGVRPGSVGPDRDDCGSRDQRVSNSTCSSGSTSSAAHRVSGTYCRSSRGRGSAGGFHPVGGFHMTECPNGVSTPRPHVRPREACRGRTTDVQDLATPVGARS